MLTRWLSLCFRLFFVVVVFVCVFCDQQQHMSVYIVTQVASGVRFGRVDGVEMQCVYGSGGWWGRDAVCVRATGPGRHAVRYGTALAAALGTADFPVVSLPLATQSARKRCRKHFVVGL